MKDEELMEKLASRARLETPPKVDITDKVMAVLEGGVPEERLAYNPLAWVAAVSAPIAAGVAIFAFYTLEDWSDSLLGLLNGIPWGLL